MKVCRKCLVESDDFYVYPKTGYRSSWCRSCQRADQQARRDRGDHTEVWRRSRLKVFGITIEEYDQLEADQDGRCAICGRPETRLGTHGEIKRLAVDHDHVTGMIRGLLCQNCNLAIGLLDDDPEMAEALAGYLRMSSKNSDSATETKLVHTE